MQIKLLKNKKM